MSIEAGAPGAPNKAEPTITENTDGTFVFHDHDEADGIGAASGVGSNTEPADGDARTRRESDDGGDSAAENAELAAAKTDEEREAIRVRRRQERKERRDARREREGDLRRQLDAQNRVIDEMRLQLDTINRRSSGADLAQLDDRINQAQSNIAYLEGVIADAAKSQNGEALAKATVELQKQLLGKDKLVEFKERVTSARGRPEAPQLDPRTVANAQSWLRDNKWYDPRGGDADSRLVLALDGQLAAEGYNPASSEYWEELTERVKSVLPKHFRDGAGDHGGQDDTRDGQLGGNGGGSGYNPGSQRKPSRSVVTGGSSTAAGSGGGKGGYVLSAERVAALKEAGVWDDPKARTDAIRRYKEYDAQQNPAARGA